MFNWQKILLGFTLLAVFLLIYSPHFNYGFPLHMDEWEHITLSQTLIEGNTHVEKGFHFFLLIISFFFNLIVIYEFLPALWAGLSALTLFYIIYKWTEGNFYLAWLSVIFFASIKSNLNLLGLWFFTPLSFVIPLIFLYLYFFAQGLIKENKKYLMISLGLMALVIISHAISFLFSIPILLILGLWYRDFIFKQLPIFMAFFSLPAIGLMFFKYTTQTPWQDTLAFLFSELKFDYGWGVMEYQNLPTEIYSPLGYILAIAGFIVILKSPALKEKFRLFLIWPAVTLLMILSYQIMAYPEAFLPANFFLTQWLGEVGAFTILAPYQRLIYYFALSLPLLSAFGTYHLVRLTRKHLLTRQTPPVAQMIALILILIPVGWLVFKDYYTQPYMHPRFDTISIRPYPIGKTEGASPIIDSNDYLALKFLAEQPPGMVLAEPIMASAVYPITKMEPLATIFPTRNLHLPEVRRFFGRMNCEDKQNVIEQYGIRYIITKEEINCNWELLYNQNTKIYQSWQRF